MDGVQTNDWTAAMSYVSSGRDLNKLPEQFLHDPGHQNRYGDTVVMLVAYGGRLNELPEYWRHDTNLRNKMGYTIEDILTERGYPVPEWWRVRYNHDIVQSSGSDCVCSVCLEENITEQIDMPCSNLHIVCRKCSESIRICPVCRVVLK